MLFIEAMFMLFFIIEKGNHSSTLVKQLIFIQLREEVMILEISLA